MSNLINNTKRVIVVDGVMLVPGKVQQVKDVKKLTAKYPRLAELIESGEVAENTDDVKQSASEEDSRSIDRRKRG